MQYFFNVQLVKWGDACSSNDYTSWPSTTGTDVKVEWTEELILDNQRVTWEFSTLHYITYITCDNDYELFANAAAQFQLLWNF